MSEQPNSQPVPDESTSPEEVPHSVPNETVQPEPDKADDDKGDG